MAQAADFFVSYTSADRAWAEWIAWQLEAEGYTVVVQAWDFTPGHDWVHEMQEATTTAKRVVAVLSAAYLKSAHGEAEWRAFYARDASGERGLLLPIRIDEVEPPGLLSTRIYVDLVGRDASSARAALLAAAQKARGKPTAAPKFPGDQALQANVTEAPRFPGELPAVWNVPFHPNPFFAGRDLLLTQLSTRLHDPEAVTRRVVLTGLGGIGKSSVAVEYVYARHTDYDLVWWVNGEQPASLLSDLAALAVQLDLAADAPQEAQVTALRGWLERHRGWLLVLDSVDDPQQVAKLLPRSPSGHVVLTSRAGVGWEPLASVLAVEVLSPADAAGLLRARTGESGPAAEAAAAALAANLGGLPLALEQAGAYVVATGTVTLERYAELFATRALELLARGQPLGYQHTVATTWSLALQRLYEAEPAAVDLLTLGSFLAPDDMPLQLLSRHAQELPEPLAGTTVDPLALADTVAALRRYSLVRVVADSLYVHRLLQTVVRAALEAKAERTWAAAALHLVCEGFPGSAEVGNWPECERLLPHALAIAEHGQRLEVEPERWLWLLTESAKYLWRRGLYWQAQALLEQALVGYRRVLGDDHPSTLICMNNLAAIRRDLGDLDGARKLHEQTLTSYRRVLGDDHPETLQSMNNLAVIRRDLGDLDGARKLHEQTLTSRRRVLGDDHPDTFNSMNNLALTLRTLGDLHGARKLHEQTLTGRRRVLSDDHPDTLGSMNNLATTRWALGDLQGARRLYEQTLIGYRRVLDEDHPGTLNLLNNLAVIRRDLGDLHGARDLLEQTLAGLRRMLGDDHPTTLICMNNLAATMADLGDLDGARELHKQTLTTRRRLLGDDHPDTIISMKNFVKIERKVRRR